MAKLTVMLKDYESRGATILTTAGEDLSGTDQRRFSLHARTLRTH